MVGAPVAGKSRAEIAPLDGGLPWGTTLGPGHLAETHYMLNDEQAARWKQARGTA